MRNGSKAPLLRDLSDAALEAAIADFRAAANGWDRLAMPGHPRGMRSKVARGVLGNLRLMDIGIAIKRKRIREGVWSLAV